MFSRSGTIGDDFFVLRPLFVEHKVENSICFQSANDKMLKVLHQTANEALARQTDSIDKKIPPPWEGKTAKRICDVLLEMK